MTTAPPSLIDVRGLLLAHLGRHGLSGAEVGIVGDAAHRGGYHCGRDRVVAGDYSVTESTRDRAGLSEFASALDIGTYTARVDGSTHTLATFSAWLAGQCAAGALDCADIREVIYSPDGKSVKRWDRLARRSSGDSSHRWHTHISYHRDATKAGRDQTSVYRRYLIHIGLLAAPPLGGRLLWRGVTGRDVGELQAALNRHGGRLVRDNAFGSTTESAVKAFQRLRRLVPDGVVGPATVTALKAPPPAVPAPDSREVTMFLIRSEDDPRYFVSCGVNRRHVPNVSALRELQSLRLPELTVPHGQAVEDVAGPLVGETG